MVPQLSHKQPTKYQMHIISHNLQNKQAHINNTNLNNRKQIILFTIASKIPDTLFATACKVTDI
jgi:hypothetical protein